MRLGSVCCWSLLYESMNAHLTYGMVRVACRMIPNKLATFGNWKCHGHPLLHWPLPQVSSYSASRDNWCTVGGDGGCRVGEVRAGTTSPMLYHKGYKLQELVHFQKFSTLRVNPLVRCKSIYSTTIGPSTVKPPMLQHLEQKLLLLVGYISIREYKVIIWKKDLRDGAQPSDDGDYYRCDPVAKLTTLSSLSHTHGQLLYESLGKNATIHQVTTMLATSENVLFTGYYHLLTTDTDDPSLTGSWMIIIVSGHQLQWLAGGYELEIGHF